MGRDGARKEGEVSAKAQEADEEPQLAWRHPAPQASPGRVPPLCWPFPPGSQNHTDKAVRLKPYVPPKRRSLNQF